MIEELLPGGSCDMSVSGIDWYTSNLASAIGLTVPLIFDGMQMIVSAPPLQSELMHVSPDTALSRHTGHEDMPVAYIHALQLWSCRLPAGRNCFST